MISRTYARYDDIPCNSHRWRLTQITSDMLWCAAEQEKKRKRWSRAEVSRGSLVEMSKLEPH